MYKNYISIILVLLCATNTLAQDTIRSKKKLSKSKITSVSNALQKSLSENNELEIAKNYEKLADEFASKNDNSKAEEYLKKALISYTTLNLIDEQTRITRRLAKSQESQQKFDDAIKNYEVASENSKIKSEEKININDANRLRNNNNFNSQRASINSNIDLLKKENKSSEVADAYKQQAINSRNLNNPEDAIKSYKNAIEFSKNMPAAVIELKTEIAKTLVGDNKLNEALAINLKLLNDATSKNDVKTQILQHQELSTIYFKQNYAQKGLEMLKRAYSIAVANGNTNEAKKCLTKLLQYYKSNDKESIALYNDFFKNFDALIQKDTTLIDAKTFQLTENKIIQLEKEKSLKDELISKKNRFNYFLIVALFLLIIFFGLIAKTLFAIKKKNKEIALQSLRREMNPHFIFNSLNSVNQFISQNKELEANKYLTSYSNLMRNIMENSNKDFVTLANEVEQLKKYLDLEHLRFQDKFDFEILVDEDLDSEITFIPNMIIQPHLENAIWHGLRYLENKGFLSLKFELINKKIHITIDDNGIGLTKSQELKTFNQMVHKSVGLDNTKQRISLLNDLYKTEITFEIKEKIFPKTGTIIEIIFPFLDKIR